MALPVGDHERSRAMAESARTRADMVRVGRTLHLESGDRPWQQRAYLGRLAELVVARHLHGEATEPVAGEGYDYSADVVAAGRRVEVKFNEYQMLSWLYLRDNRLEGIADRLVLVTTLDRRHPDLNLAFVGWLDRHEFERLAVPCPWTPPCHGVRAQHLRPPAEWYSQQGSLL